MFQGAEVHPAAKPASYPLDPAPLHPLMAALSQPWTGARTRAAFNEFFQTKVRQT